MADKYANETADEFASRLFGTVSGGFTTMAIALGVRTGLFNVLVDHHDTPMTSQELADAAGLKERYVREWLGAMTTAFIVEVDPATNRYRLPPHRVESFRAGSMMGQRSQLSFGLVSSCDVFLRMEEVFKKDGPLGLTWDEAELHSEFTNFYGSAWYNHCFVQDFIPSQPEIQSKLEKGIRMLDIGCGRGRATRLLAQRFPNSHFVGLDLDQSGIDIAKEESKRIGLTNTEYVYCDASAMPDDWTETFDYVFFFNVLHDLPRPDLVVDDVKRVIKKGGIMSVFEIDLDSKHANNLGIPHASMMYSLSLFYCLPLASNYPGSLALGTAWGKDRVKAFLEERGFAIKSIARATGLPQAHFLCESV